MAARSAASSTAGPSGIPAVTYVRIMNPEGGGAVSDILSDSSSVTILEPNKPSSRHDASSFVLPRGITDQETCESTIGQDAGGSTGGGGLNPVTAFVTDAASAVLFLIGSKATRKSLFAKRTFLPFLANEIFGTIDDKRKLASGVYQTQLRLSAFEIQDEVITDLLRPSSRGLNVSITADEGVKVVGLHREYPINELALRKALDDCCENRVTHTQPPGASIETSSAVFEIELSQTEELDGASVRHSISKLVLVDVPCTNALALGGSDLRQLEGPTLHKSLLTFADVAKKLTSPAKAAIAPFRASKLTSYLAELLGGNALAIAIGTLAPGEPAVSRKTMELLEGMSSSVHFPIGGHELTEMVQGLLIKYRSMVLQLQDEIENGAVIGEKPAEVSEKAIRTMQQEVAKALNDRNVAKDDCAKLYEMMELLKAKYQTLTEQKAAQAEELIKAEEEKLITARALVELKIEHSHLLESSENERFELSSGLLSSKKRISELEKEETQLQNELAALKATLSERDVSLAQEQMETASLKATLQEVRSTLARERDKNLELGAELLTLINQRDELQRKCNGLQQSLDDLALRSDSQGSDLKEQLLVAEELRSELKVKEHEFLDLRKELLDMEVELKSTQLELQATKESLERSSNDSLREKEEIFNKARKAAEVDIQRALKDLEEAQVNNRRSDKRLRDKERELQRCETDLQTLNGRHQKTIEELDQIRQNFRDRLSSMTTGADATFLASIADSLILPSSGQSSRANSAVPPDGSLRPTSTPRVSSLLEPTPPAAAEKSMSLEQLARQAKRNEENQFLSDLLQSYLDRELRLRQRTEESEEIAEAFKRAYRKVFDRYRELLDVIEETVPDRYPPESQIINERHLVSSMRNPDGPQDIDPETLLAKERTELRGRIKEAEDAAFQEKERAAGALVEFKTKLDVAEAKLVLLKSESKSLHAQIKSLTSNIDTSSKSAQEVAVSALYSSEMSRLEEENAQLRQALALANAQLRSQTAVARSLDGIGDATGEKNQVAAMMENVRVAEKRNIELVTRNASLEEELKGYQTYMKDTVMLYRRQIQALKTQLTNLAVATGVAPQPISSTSDVVAPQSSDKDTSSTGSKLESVPVTLPKI